MNNNQNWPLIPLIKITTKIGSGATPRGGKESYKSKGISLIRSQNVYDFYFDYDGLAFIDERQAKDLENVTVEVNDILLNITGASVARCCIVPKKILPARVNQHVSIVRINPENANARYVLYVINSSYYKSHLLTIAQGGATREALTKEKIETFEIPNPSLDTQNKIASILSAYDDMIENNTRRIRILEEMAQAVYREWFVNFHFPGHEGVRMVGSAVGMIPEGWEITNLDTIAEINPSQITRGIEPENINYIDIASVTTGRIENITEMAFSNAPSRARRIVKHGDIIWSTVRPNRKSFALILEPLPNLIVSTGFAVIRPVKVPFSFLYHATTTDDFTNYLVNHATGAAYPAVNQDVFEKSSLVLPDEKTLHQFDLAANDLFLLRHNLLEKNNNLRKQRDLLLPRLVSGELNIEE